MKISTTISYNKTN